jgi:hypothetical protein
MPQVVGHILGRQVTVSGSLGQSFEANPFQLLRDGLINLPKGTWLKIRDLLQQLS